MIETTIRFANKVDATTLEEYRKLDKITGSTPEQLKHLDNMVNLVLQGFDVINRIKNKSFEAAILKNATPKIKGKITKGKLKWRGIKLCFRTGEKGSIESWIQQRDIIISEIIKQ